MTTLPPFNAVRDRAKTGRGWNRWSSVSLLLPLLLLAGLGIRGIGASRRTALDSARADAAKAVEYGLRLLEEEIATLRASARKVRFYAAVPEPAESGEADQLYARALDAPPDEAATAFVRMAADFPDAVSSSGVPLLPLIEWARLSKARSLEEFLAHLASLGRTAVETHPSILTPILLDRAGTLASEWSAPATALDPFRRVWAEDESVRHALSQASAGQTTAGPKWILAEEKRLWIEPESDRCRVVPFENFRAAAEHVLPETATFLPPSVRLSTRWNGIELLPVNSRGELLAQRTAGPLSIAAHIVDPSALYRQQRRQTFWLAALLAVAVLAVFLAFHAMQRALDSQRWLNERKSDFVASVSHELRAPVASMGLMLENLESGAVTSEAARSDYLRLLEGECRRLSTLIENVLDFARIEHNRRVYNISESDVPALVRDAIDLLQPRAAQRRQEIRSELQPLEHVPSIDALAIQQALINLLDNAIKFSPEGTSIIVAIAPRDSNNWELSVSDQGPGIDASEHERIFERFYRIGSELRRETQGSGIGLSIVKHTVEAHGGSIEVESRPGAGAIFTIILPYCIHDRKGAAIADVAPNDPRATSAPAAT